MERRAIGDFGFSLKTSVTIPQSNFLPFRRSFGCNRNRRADDHVQQPSFVLQRQEHYSFGCWRTLAHLWWLPVIVCSGMSDLGPFLWPVEVIVSAQQAVLNSATDL